MGIIYLYLMIVMIGGGAVGLAYLALKLRQIYTLLDKNYRRLGCVIVDQDRYSALTLETMELGQQLSRSEDRRAGFEKAIALDENTQTKGAA